MITGEEKGFLFTINSYRVAPGLDGAHDADLVVAGVALRADDKGGGERPGAALEGRNV